LKLHRLSIQYFRTVPSSNTISGRQRSSSSSSFSANSDSATTTDYQPRFASRLSTTRLPTTAPAGSHDQIAGDSNTIDPIAQPSSTAIALPRNRSTTNAQPQQFVTMTETATTTFCYVPASDSVAYSNNLARTDRSTTISHH
jgi:hypothetical protein